MVGCRKLAEQSSRRFIVGGSGSLFARKAAQIDNMVVFADLSAPGATPPLKRNTLEFARFASLQMATIPLILIFGRCSQICTTVVKAVPVSVIHFLARLSIHKQAMHSDHFLSLRARQVRTRIPRAGAILPCVPSVLTDERPVRIVDKCHPAFRERDLHFNVLRSKV